MATNRKKAAVETYNSNWVDAIERAVGTPLYAIPATPAQQDAERFRQRLLDRAAGARLERATAAKRQTRKATQQRTADRKFLEQHVPRLYALAKAELTALAAGRKPSQEAIWRRVSYHLNAEYGLRRSARTLRQYL
jgi:hypothetical protein